MEQTGLKQHIAYMSRYPHIFEIPVSSYLFITCVSQGYAVEQIHWFLERVSILRSWQAVGLILWGAVKRVRLTLGAAGRWVVAYRDVCATVYTGDCA